jgi:hypothetical protein
VSGKWTIYHVSRRLAFSSLRRSIAPSPPALVASSPRRFVAPSPPTLVASSPRRLRPYANAALRETGRTDSATDAIAAGPLYFRAWVLKLLLPSRWITKWSKTIFFFALSRMSSSKQKNTKKFHNLFTFTIVVMLTFQTQRNYVWKWTYRQFL